MDLYVAQLPGLSVAEHLSRELAKDSSNMPDGKSWRIGHSKQPKKQHQVITPLRVDSNLPAAPEEPVDRRRQASWRKTLQGSRPQTPVSTLATTVDDIEDTQSERSETPTARRDSRPKLARYTSLFTSIKETAKTPDFSEPWGEDAPQPFQSHVDLIQVMQSVQSHIMNSYSPLPSEHHSGLLRLFEEYRKIREQKERLDTLLRDVLRDWGQAEECWSQFEDRYNAEIRRLELIIARGATGMAELVQARQGSIIDCKRKHRKTISQDSFRRDYEFFPVGKLDAEINSLSRRVLLHRPMSPSGNMAVMSKLFSHSSEFLMGTPPDSRKTKTLSRKVQSELNLSTVRKIRAPPSFTDSIVSAFSAVSGDTLPDEAPVTSQTSMDPATECNALFALRELGTLVARRRGLQPESFNRGLMMLFSQARPAEAFVLPSEENKTDLAMQQDTSMKNQSSEQSTKQTPTVRKFQSQPQLNTHQKHQRQFSFEPGADQLHALTEEATPSNVGLRNGNSANSDTSSPIHGTHQVNGSESPSLTCSSQNLSADFVRPSKIPSPVQSLGRSRKESSASSLQSVYSRPQESRRGSSSSVLTAFRENASGGVRPPTQSRNSSMQSLHATGPPPGPRDYYSGTGLRNNKLAATAAAAASTANNEHAVSRAEDDSPKATKPRANEEQGLIKVEKKVSAEVSASQ